MTTSHTRLAKRPPPLTPGEGLGARSGQWLLYLPVGCPNQAGALDQLNQLTKDFGNHRVPGFIESYVYLTDADSNACYLAVVFESKAPYVANAESPEQDARYWQMRALFEDDPEWHEGEIVASATAG